MKKSLVLASLLLAGTTLGARAADMAIQSKVDWTGFYAGVHTGYGFGSADWSNPTGYYEGDGKKDVLHEGLIFGAQGGYNYQTGPYVIGAEADVDFGLLDSEANVGGRGTAQFADFGRTRTDVLASLAARFGYAYGPALFYAKAGIAYAHDKYSVEGFPIAANATEGTADENRFGWVAGLGVEYALGGNWSAKLEYDYYGFGDRRVGFSPKGNADPGSFKVGRDDQLVKFGLNYRFGGNDAEPETFALGPDFEGEFGARIGLSDNYFRKKLYDPVAHGQLNSQLTYKDMTGLSGEVFARIDAANGLFAKGYFSGIDLFSGKLYDEDFPPAAVPYSKTSSDQSNGRGVQGALDIGYTAFKGENWRLGGYLGYEILQRRESVYGCTQVAGNGEICAPGDVAPGALTLSENERWQGLRLGVSGDYWVTSAIKLTGDATYLPYANFEGFDNHWLRPDINALKEHANSGYGFELEGVASYYFTKNLSAGIGGRYTWLRSNDGYTNFPQTPKSPEKFETQNLGAFLQVAYHFGDIGAVSK